MLDVEAKQEKTGQLISKMARDYAQYRHGEEYDDPCFKPDVQATVSDFKAGVVEGMGMLPLIANLSQFEGGNTRPFWYAGAIIDGKPIIIDRDDFELLADEIKGRYAPLYTGEQVDEIIKQLHQK